MKRVAKWAGVVFGVLALFVTGLVVRAVLWSSRQVPVEPVKLAVVAPETAAKHLAEAIRFRTISKEGAGIVASELAALQQYLAETYPNAYKVLEKHIFQEHTLLLQWKGSDPSLKPILLMAHQDVVPVETDTEGQWEHPPFEGQIADGFVWGRGAIDDKVNVIGLLEAVDALAREGITPKRTVYLLLGHDEEIGGATALTVADYFRQQGIALEYVLDEGMAIYDGVVPGLSAPVALIGIAEKGIMSLELTAEAEGGHSSMPPPGTAIGELATAIHKLEANPMPGGIDGVVGQMFDHLGPEMKLLFKLMFANRWLFGSLLEGKLASKRTTNALIRTTTATTIIQGGVKENILPTRVTAVVNFRILPGDTSEEIIAHVKRVVDDPEIKISIKDSRVLEASRISPTDSQAFQDLQKTIRQIFPDALVAPGLVIARTDSRHFEGLSPNIYRFRPQIFDREDVKRYHNANERMSLENLNQTVNFYYQLIKNTAL